MSVRTRITTVDGMRIEEAALTPHFWESEFRVIWPKKVSVWDRFYIPVVDYWPELAAKMANICEVIRAEFNRPMTITDCLRPSWLDVEGGAPRSRHRPEFFAAGVWAIDFKIKGVRMKEVAHRLNRLMDLGYVPQGGLGLYEDHVHYDTRGRRARWGF